MTTISLPWPNKALSSNSRAHWRVKAFETAHCRWLAWMLVSDARMTAPDAGDIAVTVRFYPPSKRFDRANMPHLAKAYLDGVADYLDVNDNRFVPNWVYCDCEKPGRIEIEIEGGETTS